MSEALTLLLALLSVYRLSYLVAVEDGPFDLFAHLRDLFPQTDWRGRGLACPICISFWVAAAFGAWLAKTPRDFVLLWLGLAGGVLVIHRYLNGRGK